MPKVRRYAYKPTLGRWHDARSIAIMSTGLFQRYLMLFEPQARARTLMAAGLCPSRIRSDWARMSSSS